MEIRTTIEELPEQIKQLGFSPNTPIRLIIDEVREQPEKEKSHFPFLHGKVWTDKEGPTDVSEHIDEYLYDTDNIHGE